MKRQKKYWLLVGAGALAGLAGVAFILWKWWPGSAFLLGLVLVACYPWFQVKGQAIKERIMLAYKGQMKKAQGLVPVYTPPTTQAATPVVTPAEPQPKQEFPQAVYEEALVTYDTK